MSKGGLAFLNKKTWHTGHIRNIEKVWQAEQKAKQEKVKLEQLRKELDEERQIEELRKLQADAGLISQSSLNRLDWMYNAAATGPSAEEYLLGKEFTADKTEAFEQVHQLKEKAGSLFLREEGNEKLEVESRLREDPMMEIMRVEQKERHQILKNPVKMQNIRKAALLDKLKKATKKMKKSHKKAKKTKKKREHRDRSSSSEKEEQDKPNQPRVDDRSSLKVSAEVVSKYGLIHLKPVQSRMDNGESASKANGTGHRSRSRSRSRSSESNKKRKKSSSSKTASAKSEQRSKIKTTPCSTFNRSRKSETTSRNDGGWGET